MKEISAVDESATSATGNTSHLVTQTTKKALGIDSSMLAPTIFAPEEANVDKVIRKTTVGHMQYECKVGGSILVVMILSI